MAARYFEGDPIGQRLLIERFPGERPYEVIAVVGNMHQDSLDSPPVPEMGDGRQSYTDLHRATPAF